MHFFHQPYHVEPVIEQRRIGYGSGFGGGYGGVFGAIPTIILDPEWHGLAEQLGFWRKKITRTDLYDYLDFITNS